MSGIKHGLAWSISYELGNEHVDSQHRRLFEIVSELIEACINGTEKEELRKTLDFLVDYTVQHFRDEEALQVECNYPDYEKHRQLHEDFKATVGTLIRSYRENGSTEELSANLHVVIAQWLVNHIQREDMKIGKYIREH